MHLNMIVTKKMYFGWLLFYMNISRFLACFIQKLN